MPEPSLEWADIDLIEPNPWNPNRMDDEMYAKAIESIHEFGFVDPVTTRGLLRPDSSHFHQIVDGEHRWRAALDHGACIKAKKGGWERHGGLRQLPIANLGAIPDEVAQQLTIVLNETRGAYDPKKMGALLIDLVAVKPLAELVAVLPFDKPKFEELAALPSVDWGDVAPKRSSSPNTGSSERWVERVYRLPAEAAASLDQAIRKVREDDGASDWQALKRIAEDFLGS